MEESKQEVDLTNWPKNEHGHFVCTKEKPMPIGAKKQGRWEHDDVVDDGSNYDYTVDYFKCNSCGHRWGSETPE